jgi:PEGA domain
MRISVSLLVLCAAITGCNTSIDPANVDSIVVTSSPPAAAVRLNGEPVGRTPATIKVDRTKNYELQVGKGGYLTEVSELKPRLITTSEGVEFGFPASVKVNLTKAPAEGEAGVPVSDNPEFKKLSKKALGEDAAKEGLKADIAATKEAATKIQASLAVREATTKARLAEIAKTIAAAKASKGNDSVAAAKLAEAELALEQATTEAATERALAEKNLKTVEARRAALVGVNTKVATAKSNVAKAQVAAKSSDGRVAQLENSYAAEIKALSESQANSNAAIKALNARADELARAANTSTAVAKAEAAKGLADLQKALEEQKVAAALANEALVKAKDAAAKDSSDAAAKAVAQANADLKALQSKVEDAEKAAAAEKTAGEAKVAEAVKNAEKALAEAKAEAAKSIADANKVAEKNLADERLAAEAKLADANAKMTEANKNADAKVAEANKVAAAAKAQADALKYSEFNARYALLESKRRTKAITEEEYKATLAELRKELAL